MVANDATKPEIKRRPSRSLFKVKVEGGQHPCVKGKVKRFRGTVRRASAEREESRSSPWPKVSQHRCDTGI